MAKLTTADWVARAKLKHGDRFDYDSTEYAGASSPVTVRCRIHGPFTVEARVHLQKRGGCKACSACSFSKAKSTPEREFTRRASIAHHGKYTYSDYVKMSGLVTITCPDHGAFRQKAYHHIAGRGCPRCMAAVLSKANTMSQSAWVAKASRLWGSRFDYSLVKYTGGLDPVVIICKKHGAFTQVARAHLQNGGCLRCALSKGEERICRTLERLGLPYQRQFRITKCRSKKGNMLPFDFAFSVGSIHHLVEFDGEQHVTPVASWGGVAAYRATVENDKIKDHFALTNGFTLTRIAYRDIHKVERIIEELVNVS
jgi:very-short-patch-repair endonuclease